MTNNWNISNDFFEQLSKLIMTHLPPEHCPLLQGFNALFFPVHFLPPFLAFLTIVLVLTWVPCPQVLEHGPQRHQEDHLQFTLVVCKHLLQDLRQFRFIQVAYCPLQYPSFSHFQQLLFLSLHGSIQDKKKHFVKWNLFQPLRVRIM